MEGALLDLSAKCCLEYLYELRERLDRVDPMGTVGLKVTLDDREQTIGDLGMRVAYVWQGKDRNK